MVSRLVMSRYSQRLLSRKFILASASVLLSFVSLWYDKMSDSVAAQLIGAALALFFSANVGAIIANKKNGTTNSE